jgi:hypothetical protein
MVKINVGGKRRPLLLKKIRDDLYVTNPMSFDEAPSEVEVTPDEGKIILITDLIFNILSRWLLCIHI